MIDLILLNKHQLLEFINSEKYKSLEVLPISYHRAVSHINNPRAKEDDVLLILAYENEQLLGYLGILADDIYTEKEKYHVGWLSCIWVSPLARGKGIAKKMVLTAYEAYKHSILITNFTKEAGLLYYKLNIFQELPNLVGYRYYRKICSSKILPKRYPRLYKFTPIFKVIDKIFNPLITLFLMDKKAKKYNTFLPNENFLEETDKHKISFKRRTKELEWILNFPWIKKVDNFSDQSKKYHFSSEEKQFDTNIIAIQNENEVIGYLLYVLRNGHLKVPYVYYKLDHIKQVADVISEISNQKNVEFVTLFLDKELLKLVKIKCIFKKPIKRQFLITKELATKIEDYSNIKIYDGDGDAVFT
jgi:GNAT superfamily N-acetyltransferase